MLGHLKPLQRLVHALVAGGAIDLGGIAGGAQAAFGLGREGRAQRFHELVVQVTHHADALPGRHALRRALGPAREGARVVAVGAVHAQGLRDVQHQAVGLLGIHGLLALPVGPVGQGRRSRHTDLVDGFRALQEGGVGVVGQGRQAHRHRRRVLRLLPGEGALGHVGRGREPALAGQGVAAVAGVAGDAGLADVRLPGVVDVAHHLQHAPRDDLGVLAVGREIAVDVAVVAALLAGHPVGHGRHRAAELADRQLGQHLHVLVGGAGHRAVRAHPRRLVDHGLAAGRQLRLHRVAIVELGHARAAVAQLLRGCRRGLEADDAQARQEHQRDEQQRPDDGFLGHGAEVRW